MPTTTTAPADTLTRADRAQLRAAEDVLQTAARWDLERARALRTIRDGRLYRAEHVTFDEYVEQKWDIAPSQAYRLIEWVNVADVISPIGETPVPTRESHARPLYGLAPEQQRECWRRVVEQHGRPTASIVSAVVQDVLKPKAPQKPAQANQRATGRVVVADARCGLRSLDDGAVDLLLTSPPYAEQRKRDYPSVPEREYPAWLVGVLDAAVPKMAPTGNVMIVAREHVRNGAISDYLLRTRLALRDAGWNEIDTLIWYKPDAPPTGRADRPRRSWEYVLWFSRSREPFTDVKAMGNPMKEPRERMARHRTIKSGHHGNATFMRFKGEPVARVTDVLTAAMGTSSAGVDHPCPYPLTLADQLVRTYSPVGGLVVDPMCGSGTTLVAARDAGRRWFGCDVVADYVAETRRRLRLR